MGLHRMEHPNTTTRGKSKDKKRGNGGVRFY